MLLWTDITYLFPEEPMELYGAVRINHIPSKLLNLELRKALADKLILWHGSMSHHEFDKPIANHVIAHMSIGALRSSDFFTVPEIESYVNEKISRFRLHELYRPKIISTSEASGGVKKNIWFTIVFQNYDYKPVLP